MPRSMTCSGKGRWSLCGVKVLLDTHLMIWWQLAHPRLPAALPDLLA